jgi:hypothetical protein
VLFSYYIVSGEQEKRATEKDLQVTLRVFFLALQHKDFADSSPEVNHNYAPYPEVIPQNVIASPNVNLRIEGKCHANKSRISNLRSLPVY